jgi:predicted kinase
MSKPVVNANDQPSHGLSLRLECTVRKLVITVRFWVAIALYIILFVLFLLFPYSTPSPGAGKTHTIKKLHERGQFPLHSFVTVDPDEMRRQLPEFPVYIERTPEKAGELTRKEVGMMAEIVTNFALEKGMNVLVDGSLKDAVWYENYFQSLRKRYPNLKIGIIHVTAPTDAILERVKERAKTTGRVVPMEVLQRSIREVPIAVERLRHSVDYFLEIHNPSEPSSSSTTTTTTTTTSVVDDPVAFLSAISSFPHREGDGSTTSSSADLENKFQLKCAAAG